MIVVLVRAILPKPRLHVLRCAAPGIHITTLCMLSIRRAPVEIQTLDLADHDGVLPADLCPACRTELAARTPGAAMCLDVGPPRATTRDLRGQREREEPAVWREWEDDGPHVVAMDDLGQP